LQKSSVIRAQAQKYLSGGNLDKALAEYERLLSSDAAGPYDFVLAGDVCLKRGDTERAVTLYVQAVDAYEGAGLYKNAAAIGKKALRLDPGLSEMHKRLGKLRVNEGLVKEAVQDFLKYHDIKTKEQDLEGAIEGLALATRAAPADVDMAEKLVKLYEEAERTADAARELARVSTVLRERGDQEGAASYYERALALDAEAISMPTVEQKRTEVKHATEELHIEHGAQPVRAAAESEEEARDQSLDEIPPEFRTGDISVKDKPKPKPKPKPKTEGPSIDLGEVLKQFKAQVDSKVSLDDSQARYDLGMTYKEMGLLEEALNEFRVASADDKQRAKAFEMVGLCHFELKQYEEALEAFSRALRESTREDDNYPGLCFNVGVTLEAMGRTEEALDRFQEVASLNSEFPGLSDKLEALAGSSEEGH
jgi:tetratricopeptide (TPR) repeat protein